MIANLKAQGLNDIVSIELSSGKKANAAAAATEAAPAPTPAKETPRPATAPAPQHYGRRAPGGASSIILG